MNKVLIVSHHFPPDAEIGAIRPFELAKYLPSYGWVPIILTVQEKYYLTIDPERKLEDLNMTIHRTNKLPTFNQMFKSIKKVLIGKKRLYSTSRMPTIGLPGNADHNGQRETGMQRLRRYYNSLIFFLPDLDHGWIIKGVLAGLSEIRRYNIDAILATSPPHSAQLIGLILSFLSGKALIADFRDPWGLDLLPERYRCKLSVSIGQMLERLVVRRARAVVSVTPEMTERLAALYPDYSSKFVTISNGFDALEVAMHRNTEKRNGFVITYTGSLYFGRDPFIFFQAISELIRDGNLERDFLEIRFIGNCRFCDGKSVEAMATDLGLKDVVTFVDSIPRSEALKEMAKSHVGLVLAPQQPLQIPGKVFDLIGMKASILCISEHGATKRLMEKYPLARTVDPNDLTGMKDAILQLYRQRTEEGGVLDGDFPYELYERRHIAKRMTTILGARDLMNKI